MAGIVVTAAEPSGPWGLLNESFAIGSTLAQGKIEQGSNPLIKAVVGDFATAEGQRATRDGLKEKLTSQQARRDKRPMRRDAWGAEE